MKVALKSPSDNQWGRNFSNVFLTMIRAVCSHHSKAWLSSSFQGNFVLRHRVSQNNAFHVVLDANSFSSTDYLKYCSCILVTAFSGFNKM